jgi:four helix bundle protein
MELVKMVYAVTRDWPRGEQFGLINQCRRAAASIPANVAKGQGRFGSGEMLPHLSIVHGSPCDLETHLILGQPLSDGPERSWQPVFDQTDEVAAFRAA